MGFSEYQGKSSMSYVCLDNFAGYIVTVRGLRTEYLHTI